MALQDRVDKAMNGTNAVLYDQIASIIEQLRAEEQGQEMLGDEMNPMEMDKEQMPGAMMGEGDRMKGDYRKQEDDDDYDEMGDMMGKGREAMKAEATGETAREDAESRTEEEQPDGSDEAMKLVDKRLTQMERSLAAMTGVVKTLYNRIKKQENVSKSNEQSIDGILEGIVTAETIIKATEPEPINNVNKGAVQYQTNELAESIVNALVSRGDSVQKSEHFDTREALGNVMTELVHGKGGK